MVEGRLPTGKQADGESQPLIQQQQMVPLQDSYVRSRAETLHNVESTIHEFGQHFHTIGNHGFPTRRACN
ncbi:hypothetical protein L6452_43917 [Arctium lappa]|uniref:Uncharacterized protein n=1 Tax=Arctium lappa TaxID=4217 RepID=A0ACB8XE72_ARCLA|nr:hypothetical protein L6452_43917 [Arctium lappa]